MNKRPYRRGSIQHSNEPAEVFSHSLSVSKAFLPHHKKKNEAEESHSESDAMLNFYKDKDNK